jgi:DnaJ-class molecular chaperone
LSPDLQKAINDIDAALADIKRAQASSNFTEIGQAYQKLDDAMKRFKQYNTGAAAPPATSQSSVTPSPTPSG